MSISRCATQRRSVLRIAVCLALAGAGPCSQAATFPVTQGFDSGAGSLRQAVLDANAAGGGTIEFSGFSGMVALTSALPQITGSVEIRGVSAATDGVNAQGRDRVFLFAAGTTNAVLDLTLRNGSVTNNENGGAIVNLGVLTLTRCVLVNNHSAGGFGGAIYNTGDLTIIGSQLASNSVKGAQGARGEGYGAAGGNGAGLGGGLWSSTGTVVVRDCTFVSNLAVGGGSGETLIWTNWVSEGWGGEGGGINGGRGSTGSAAGEDGGYGGGGGGSYPGFPAGRGGFGGGGGGASASWTEYGERQEGGYGGGRGSSTISDLVDWDPGRGGAGGGLGGGIFLESGLLRLEDSWFLRNRAIGGAEIAASGGAGLGAALFINGGRAVVSRCTLSENGAQGGAALGSHYVTVDYPGWAGGGAALIRDGTVLIIDSTMTGNESLGGLAGTSAKAASKLGGAAEGGALRVEGGTVAVTNCTVSGNRSVGGNGAQGTGLWQAEGGAGRGGGISVMGGDVLLMSCTVASNLTSGGVATVNGLGEGGGLYQGGGSASLRNTLFSGNDGTRALHSNPIPAVPDDTMGTVNSQGGNLITVTNGSTGWVTTDQVNVDPLLGPLGLNGGLHRTHALRTGSPAIDAGIAAEAPLTDQRGVARPQGGGVDIGAFEAQMLFVVADGEYTLSDVVQRTNTITIALETAFVDGVVVYTLDGTAPTPTSLMYTQPFVVTNEVTLRALAYSADFSRQTELGPIRIVFTPWYTLAVNAEGAGQVTVQPQQANYLSNTVVTVTARPAAGWLFLGWAGDASGASPVQEVRMDRDKVVTGVFREIPRYALTVTQSGVGTVTVEPAGTSFLSNTVVTLRAIPAPSWSFAGWSGNASGVNPVLPMLMSGDRGVHAAFAPLYTVRLATAGGGRASVVPAQVGYASNTMVTFTATPSNGWAFLGWKGDLYGTQAEAQRAVSRCLDIQAVFGTALTTNVSGFGSLTVTPPEAWVPFGSRVRVDAVPETGYQFALWAGAASGNVTPYFLTVTNPNPQVSALFAPVPAGQAALGIRVRGVGSVSQSPVGNAFPAGQTLTLVATPGTGQQFLGWSGEGTWRGTTGEVVLDQSKTVTATFSEVPRLEMERAGDGVLLRLVAPSGSTNVIEAASVLPGFSLWQTVSSPEATSEVWIQALTNKIGFYRTRSAE